MEQSPEERKITYQHDIRTIYVLRINSFAAFHIIARVYIAAGCCRKNPRLRGAGIPCLSSVARRCSMAATCRQASRRAVDGFPAVKGAVATGDENRTVVGRRPRRREEDGKKKNTKGVFGVEFPRRSGRLLRVYVCMYVCL